MRRIRGTVWAIALWTIVLGIYALSGIVSEPLTCDAGGVVVAECPVEILAIVILIAFGVVWLIGAIVLLATNPSGVARAFLVQVIVNMLALLVTLGVLSLVRLPSAGPGGVQEDRALLTVPDLFVVGGLFALVNALARPVLFAFFGRLILRTLGLAVIVVNAVLFWLVGELSGLLGNPWLTPDPRLLWIIVDSVVFTAILTLLNAFLGMDRPRLDAHGESRVWRFIERLPAQRRNALVESIRLQEVYETLSRYGLEIVVGGSILAPVRRLGDRMMGRSSAALEALSTPAKVRVMLQELGPTFVKVGQMASSRADALPQDWRDELDKLQSTVPPFPWDEARAIIASELDADPDVLFASVDHEPFGAASLAQVHRATLHDGREVVVKVQRPDVQAKVRADLGVIQELAAVAESRLAIARQVDASGLAREFADGVLEELDYTVEAYHARRLADIVSSIPGVGVPAIHGEFSTSRVLTMDFAPGVKATKADRLDPGVDREQVARTFMRAVIKQILIEGFFHADPHPGNIVLDPATGRVVFLDLGLVGELRQEQRFDLLALLWALRMKDPGALATVSLRLCTATGPLDEPSYRAAVERLFFQYWVYGGASFSRMMSALFAVLRQHGLRMRHELTLAVKSITQAEELLRAIAPDLGLVDTATQEAEHQLRAELTPERVQTLLRGQLAGLAQAMIDGAVDHRAEIGPLILAAITGGRLAGFEGRDQLDLGPLEQRVAELGARLERAARRAATTTSAVGLAIGLSLLLGALILNPGVQFDGAVLIVGTMAAIALGFLGYLVVQRPGGRD